MPSLNYTGLLGLGQGQLWAQQLAGQNRTQLPGAPTASSGNLQGSNPQGGAGPYGGLPQVPNPFATQGSAITGNAGNLQTLGPLSTSLNTLIANNAALPYQLNLPNYGANVGQSSSNITDLLRGQVPQDVVNQLERIGAERGIGVGPGGPNANAAWLGALGQTSLGLQAQGEQELTAAIGRTPTGQQFNPASFLVSPQQAQEAQYLSNLLSAAPDPTQAANASLQNTLAGYGFGRQQGPTASGFNYPTSFGGGLPLGPSYAGGQQPLGGGNPPPGTQGYASQYGEPIGPPNYYQYDQPIGPEQSQYDQPIGPMDPGWEDLFGGGDFGGF